MDTSAIRQEKAPFAIFRRRDAVDFDSSGLMHAEEMSATAQQGGANLAEAGYGHGYRLKLLFAMPGMSLTHVWFKSGFPLPRHSHDTDCLYYIIAGTIRLGTEELGPGDGFMVGSDVPYHYTPGAAGVELLEFRASNSFNIRMLADNPAFWEKAVATVEGKQDAWHSETMPRRSGP